jgi:hypothetical protein
MGNSELDQVKEQYSNIQIELVRLNESMRILKLA